MPPSQGLAPASDAGAGAVPVPVPVTVDSSTKERRVQLVAALNDSKDLRLHVQRLALGVAACDDSDAWLEVGLVEALLQLLKSLPGDHLSREDTPSVCAAAVAILNHVGELQFVQNSISSSSSRNVLAALAQDRDAWAALIKWGIRSSSATQPLSVDVSMLLLPSSQRFSAPNHERQQWSARLLSLVLPCHCCAEMQQMQPEWSHTAQRLRPAAREAVLEHVLEFLASHTSAHIWTVLFFLATTGNDTVALLRKLLPQLRLALEFHSSFLADPANRMQLGPALGQCIGMSLEVLLLLVGPSFRPAGRSADPCWDLFLLALDTSLQVMAAAAPDSPEIGHKDALTCDECLATLLRQVQRQECLGAMRALLAQEQRLCRWVGLAHRLQDGPQTKVLLLAAVASKGKRANDDHSEVPLNVQITEQLLTHGVDGLAACHADRGLQTLAVGILSECMRTTVDQRHSRRQLLDAALPRLPQLSSMAAWGSPAKLEAEFQAELIIVLCCAVQLAPILPELWACPQLAWLTPAFRKLAIADALQPVTEELHYLELLTRPGVPAPACGPSGTTFPWLLAVGDCIEVGPPVWLEGCAITAEELWEFVAEVTRQRSSGQQLRRLYEGLQGRRAQLASRQQAAAAVEEAIGHLGPVAQGKASQAVCSIAVW